MFRPSVVLLVLALAACRATPAEQAPLQTSTSRDRCVIPEVLEPARAPTPPDADPDPPTSGYALALSWSPEFCRFRAQDQRYASQCAPPQSFGFIVHGLWPQGEPGDHPRHCALAPPLTQATMRAHFCMMPSADLMQHEWAAHGTCAWERSEAYFAQTAALWRALRMPDLESLPRELTGADIRDAFVAVNPGLPREAIYLDIDRGKGWLKEVRLCYDLAFAPEACPADYRGAGDGARVQVWRRRG